MSDLLTPDVIERMAKEAGMSIGELCESANIAPSTFYRWKKGRTKPTLEIYERLYAVITKGETRQ